MALLLFRFVFFSLPIDKDVVVFLRLLVLKLALQDNM